VASVLIVDDEEPFREACATHFRYSGWNAFTASGGREALDFLREHPGAVDAVILDRRMPDMSGDEVIRQLYDDGVLGEICVIMLTAYADLDSAIEALQAGAWQYLVKPIRKLDQLVKLLAPGVALKKCRREQAAILGSRTVEDAFARLRAVIQETLRPDLCEVMFLSDRYAIELPGLIRPENRGFVVTLQQRFKPYIAESGQSEVFPLDPVLKGEAKSLMAVPVFENFKDIGGGSESGAGRTDISGVLEIESRHADAFSPRWLEVLRYCADLIGEFEGVRDARLVHDFILMRELRHRLSTSVHVMMAAVKADAEAAGLVPEDSSLAVIGRHVEIVNAVLQEAKEITDGPRIKEMRATAADRVIDEAIRDGRASSAPADVTFDRTGELHLKVQADPAAIAYCLGCIVRNAVEAIQDRRLQDPSPIDGSVILATRRHDRAVQISVTDNGIGFSQDVRERLFNPLFSTKTGVKNEGIGLYSIRRIVEKMGGHIEASSGGSLQGATFTITLRQA
jgi:two-component system cell cycle sensor histidine kinase/response regulator CckA